MSPRLNRLLAVLCALGALWPVCARAVVFDWDQSYATWTGTGVGGVTLGPQVPTASNSASKVYNNDSAHTGNDVTITLANAVGTWNTLYPAKSTAYDGGTNQNALTLGFTSETSTTQGLTVTIAFNYTSGVSGVTFSIYDVDYSAGTWIDQIDHIWAVSSSGAIIGPSSVTDSQYNYITGTGTNVMVTGSGGNARSNQTTEAYGNMTVNFGSNIVTQVSFRWKNIDAAMGDQKIALGDITYANAAPEVGPGFAAIAICGLVLIWHKVRKRNA